MAERAPWLDAVVRDVRLHAEAALLRRLDAGAGFADPRIASQLYLRDPAANARIASGTLRPVGTHKDALSAIERAIAEVAAAPASASPLPTVRARMGLGAVDGALLVVALAYAVDLDTRELVHALASRRRPALYVETCADVLAISPHELLAALGDHSPLRAGQLIEVDGDGLAAALAISPPLLALLLGDRELPVALTNACAIIPARAELGVELPPAVMRALDALVPRLAGDAPIAVVLRGPRGAGRRAAAHRLATALDRPLLAINTPALCAAESRPGALLAMAIAAARLRGALVFLGDADAMYDDTGAIAAGHVAAFALASGPIVIGTTGRSGTLAMQRPQLLVSLPRAELADRERSWRTALARVGAVLEDGTPPERDAVELAARYVIGPGAIAEVTEEAARHAIAAGAPLSRELVEASVARRLSLRLGTAGAVVSRKALMSELVLPDDVIDTLRDMIAMVRERSQILERWGYQRHLGISRGVAGLFSGEPGTGKTMAASVIASELGLELVRIDLSAVVSKYVGETEKNLGKIFDEAQDAHAMLLFDEADSLFGKRTELKTAQDRFANLEVNYILQRMETFDGVSVLTTNAEASIDPALQRRLNFRVRFPEPELDERARLWRQLLPPATALHARVDFRALAERFDMTGGYIKNAVVRAAVIAARAGRAMSVEDLWTGAHHEYVEMGKVMPQLPPTGAGAP